MYVLFICCLFVVYLFTCVVVYVLLQRHAMAAMVAMAAMAAMAVMAAVVGLTLHSGSCCSLTFAG